MALVQLAAYCLVMFISTFSIGLLPILLSRSISEKTNRRLSLFGIGLLLGTAFTIIIPEGISTILRTPNLPTHDGKPRLPQHGHHHSSIGFALLAGFICMFLIDQASSSDPPTLPSSHDHQPSPSTAAISPEDLTNCSTISTSPGQPLLVHQPLLARLHPPQPQPHQRSLLAPTIGLLTHSLADGISLGASATLSSHSLDFVIFFAILVHKAPVACALVTVLVGDGLPRHIVRRVLLGFSLAAPTGALLTYAIVSLFIGSGQQLEEEHYWIGIALLFSGGTFLFVAVHAMLHCMSPSLAATQNTSEGPLFVGRWATSILVVGGMIAPPALLAGFGHPPH